MIGIICAMKEERDALLKLMEDVEVKKGKKLLYQGNQLDNDYYLGKIDGKEVILTRCGIGKVYAAIVTTLMLEKFKPELIINLGCAGSLNEDVHVGDVVVCNRVGDWEFDVFDWERSITSDKVSFPCDEKVKEIVKDIDIGLNIHVGDIVSSDQFIYKKSQVNTIKRFFPTALCGEMEGVSVGASCYARGVNVSIIRSISDEALVNGSYKMFDFNLEKVCENAALLCKEIIKKY